MLRILVGTPANQRFGLRTGYGVATLQITVDCPGTDALQECSASCLARLGRREEERQPEIGGFLVRAASSSTASRCSSPPCAAVATSTTLRTRSGYAAANCGQHNLPASSREIDLRQPEGGNQAPGVLGHLSDVVGRTSVRFTDARVVEHHHRAIPDKGIHHCRIPRIHVAGKVLQQNQRRSGRRSQPAIRERDPCALDEFGGRGLQTVHRSFRRDLGFLHLILTTAVAPQLNSISLRSIETINGVGTAFPSGVTSKHPSLVGTVIPENSSSSDT